MRSPKKGITKNLHKTLEAMSALGRIVKNSSILQDFSKNDAGSFTAQFFCPPVTPVQ